MASGSLLKVSLLCLSGFIVRGSIIFAFSGESICSILRAIRIFFNISTKPQDQRNIHKENGYRCVFVCLFALLSF